VSECWLSDSEMELRSEDRLAGGEATPGRHVSEFLLFGCFAFCLSVFTTGVSDFAPLERKAI
jgi:hypothetical protein